jgi:phosphohistidine phosphatase
LKIELNINQSAVIPFRKEKGSIEILLITSIKKKKWIIPKGYIEFNLSAFESAKKEAYEEAGIIGTNETIELGHFTLNKSTGKNSIVVFSMEVIKLLDNFPEKELRRRKWFSINEAAEVVSISEISRMILNLQAFIS